MLGRNTKPWAETVRQQNMVALLRGGGDHWVSLGGWNPQNEDRDGQKTSDAKWEEGFQMCKGLQKEGGGFKVLFLITETCSLAAALRFDCRVAPWTPTAGLSPGKKTINSPPLPREGGKSPLVALSFPFTNQASLSRPGLCSNQRQSHFFSAASPWFPL